MALWFLRGLQKGVVTTRYPAATDPSAAALPTPPVFDEHLLSVAVADRLVEICPSHALVREGSSLLFDVGACSACGRCMSIVAGVARPSGTFELATNNREHLVKRIACAAAEASL